MYTQKFKKEKVKEMSVSISNADSAGEAIQTAIGILFEKKNPMQASLIVANSIINGIGNAMNNIESDPDKATMRLRKFYKYLIMRVKESF